MQYIDFRKDMVFVNSFATRWDRVCQMLIESKYDLSGIKIAVKKEERKCKTDDEMQGV